MRTIIVTGRIVADAQKKSTKGGNEYLSFRIGNNEYNDEKDETGKPITHWYNVSSFDSRIIALQRFLTKGKPIIITGAYADRIYQNRNTGNCEIARDIRAFSIDFQLGNSQNTEDNPSGAAKTASVKEDEIPKVTSSAPAPQPQPKAKVDDDDDDLPF